MKVIFYHFTLVLTGWSFCSFTVCTWLRFLSEVGGAGSFSVSAKNWSDSLAACEVRHAWEPLDLLFQMFSWSPLSEIFLISSFQIVSWCHPCKYPLSFPLPPFQISFSTSLSQMCAEFIFANFWRTQYLLLLRLLKKSICQRYLSAIYGDLVLSSANLNFLIMISIQSKALTPRWQFVLKDFATKSGKIQTYWKAHPPR